MTIFTIPFVLKSPNEFHLIPNCTNTNSWLIAIYYFTPAINGLISVFFLSMILWLVCDVFAILILHWLCDSNTYFHLIYFATFCLIVWSWMLSSIQYRYCQMFSSPIIEYFNKVSCWGSGVAHSLSILGKFFTPLSSMNFLHIFKI